MNTKVNTNTTEISLSAEQLAGINEVQAIMGRLGLKFGDVKAYYKAHVKPKPVKRVLSIEQRAAVSQIRVIIRRFNFTEAEMSGVFGQVNELLPPELREEAAPAKEVTAPVIAVGAAPVMAQKPDPIGVALAQVAAKREHTESAEAVEPAQAQAHVEREPGSPMRPWHKGWVKYRHPNTGETWDGNGQKPGWLQKALLIDGMSLRDLVPVENFPLDEEMAGLPAGVPFEELAERFGLKQRADAKVSA